MRILIALALLCCAVSAGPLDWFKRKDRSADSTEARQTPRNVRATYLDTLTRGKEISLTDKDLVVVMATPASPAAEKAAPSTGGGAPKAGPATADGFRIQCFATSEIERARTQKLVLEEKLKAPVYVVFENPFYKIMVGDFVNRTDAEAALPRVRGQGYPDAWIAAGKVNLRR